MSEMAIYGTQHISPGTGVEAFQTHKPWFVKNPVGFDSL